jgi:putative restriction endonuclease
MVPHERWGALAVKGVFEISGNSRYDDFITERYHFPANYRAAAKEIEGDWILYRETRVAGGRMAYVATAFVEQIDPDEADPAHYYARIRDYLPFDDVVPYRDKDGRFAERFLRDMASPGDAGRTLRGKSLRIIDNDDFVAIVNQGLGQSGSR